MHAPRRAPRRALILGLSLALVLGMPVLAAMPSTLTPPGPTGLEAAAPPLDLRAGLASPEGADTPGARILADLHVAAAHLGIAPEPLPMGPCPTFPEAIRGHFAYLGLEAPEAIPALPSAALEDAVACLLDAMLAADRARDAAFAGTDWAQVFRDVFHAEDLAAPHVEGLDVAPVLRGALTVAARIDPVLDAARLHQQGTPAPEGGDYGAPEIDIEPVFAYDSLGDTFYGLDYNVVIDVAGNDLYDNNAGGGIIAFGGGPFIPPTGDESTWQHVIDPLGTDQPHVVYGGQFEDSELVFSASVFLDTDGDDTYGVFREPGRDGVCTSSQIIRRVATQGTGVGGLGMLVDEAGDNWLRGRVLAQGMGHVAGVGVLYLGPGDDRLDAVRSAQGSGVFGGVGVLINEDGHDTYTMVTPPGGTFNADLSFCDDIARYGQGSGFGRVTGVATGMMGILRDLGGDDAYRIDQKGQGFGMVNAYGFHIDEAGNDLRSADKKAMGFAEGHSSTGGAGVGLLWDQGGDDTYLLKAPRGLGAGGGDLGDPGDIPPPSFPPTLWVNQIVRVMVDPVLITGVGVLLDEGGDDTYSLPDRGDQARVLLDGMVGWFEDRDASA